MSDTDYVNFRLYTRTAERLRYIYGVTGEKMIAVVDRLVEAEFNEVKRQAGEIADEQQDSG